MALVRWQPFSEVESLQQQMNRLFNSLLPTNEDGLDGGTAFMPAVEIDETPEAIHLKLEVPGLEAKDLDIQVTKEAVLVKGERSSESKTEQNGVIRSEFRYGSFRRIIPLSTQIQNEQVEAQFKNGILTLNLPKIEAEKNKVVKVNLG